MRVLLRGHAVRRPARVSDADFAGEALRPREPLQLGDAPGRAYPLERRVAGLAVHHSDPGRIVAAVFEPLQPLDEEGNDVTLGYGSDDSAHVRLYFFDVLIGRFQPGMLTCLARERVSSPGGAS